MRRVFAATIFVLGLWFAWSVPAGADGLPTLPEGKRWVLEWGDEFDGTVIDRTKWNVSPAGPRGAGLWSPGNVYLDGEGHIVFRATLSDGLVVGAGIDSFRHFATTGGFFTFRCRLSTLPGYRPAIWITSESVNNVGDEGRDGTEIDVMEQPGRAGSVSLNLHWDGYGADHKQAGTVIPIVGALDDWHEFSVWWGPDRYVFYVDGQEAWATDAGGVSQVDQIIKIAIETPFKIEKFERPPFGPHDVFVCDYAKVYKGIQ
jgi:beta-glucanase (GH16 family)